MKNKTQKPQTIPTHLLNQITGGYTVNLHNQNRNRLDRDGLVHTCPKVVIGGTQPK